VVVEHGFSYLGVYQKEFQSFGMLTMLVERWAIGSVHYFETAQNI
jgi:hypothetical protein